MSTAATGAGKQHGRAATRTRCHADALPHPWPLSYPHSSIREWRSPTAAVGTQGLRSSSEPEHGAGRARGMKLTFACSRMGRCAVLCA